METVELLRQPAHVGDQAAHRRVRIAIGPGAAQRGAIHAVLEALVDALLQASDAAHALLGAGLELTHFDEPEPTADASPSRTASYRRVPWFMVMEWRKTRGSGLGLRRAIACSHRIHRLTVSLSHRGRHAESCRLSDVHRDVAWLGHD